MHIDECRTGGQEDEHGGNKADFVQFGTACPRTGKHLEASKQCLSLNATYVYTGDDLMILVCGRSSFGKSAV